MTQSRRTFLCAAMCATVLLSFNRVCRQGGQNALWPSCGALEFRLIVRPRTQQASGPLDLAPFWVQRTGGLRAIPVRGLPSRLRSAGVRPWARDDRNRAAGFRPVAPPRAEPRACRHQGQSDRCGLERPDRLGIDPDQPRQRGAQGDRRQRRRTTPGPYDRPQGLSVRGRRARRYGFGPARSPLSVSSRPRVHWRFPTGPRSPSCRS